MKLCTTWRTPLRQAHRGLLLHFERISLGGGWLDLALHMS